MSERDRVAMARRFGGRNQRQYWKAHGYPMKAFGNWRTWLRRADRAAGTQGHWRKFSEADKRRIVEQAVQPGASLSEVARR